MVSPHSSAGGTPRARNALIPFAACVAFAAVQGCTALDIQIDAPDAALDGDAGDAALDSEASEAAACVVPDGGWSGCASSGCLICPDRTAKFPLYFKNHTYCAPSSDCRGIYATCGGDCPPPAATDQCDGTSGQWLGCRGTGCSVCTELVVAYPKYFERHPNCIPNDLCKNEYYACSAACPVATAGDR